VISDTGFFAQCGPQGCNNRPDPFPGQTSCKATKLGLWHSFFHRLTANHVKAEKGTTTTLHPFNGLFSRTTWVSWHQKSKPFSILLEQSTRSGKTKKEKGRRSRKTETGKGRRFRKAEEAR